MKIKPQGAIAVFTVICILLSMTCVTYALTSDIAGHWAEKEITSFLNEGIASGYPDGSFKPDNSVTRAEFVKLINKIFKFRKTTEFKFNDVSQLEWFSNDFSCAVAENYIKGYDDGSIKPNNNITRQEASVMLARILKLDDAANSNLADSFNDAADIADWARSSVGGVVSKQLVKGYPDNTFCPNNFVTRAEAVVFLHRILNSSLSPSLTSIKAISATNGSIIIELASNVSELTKDDYKVTAQLNSSDYELNNLTFDSSKNSFSFTSVSKTSSTQTLVITVSASSTTKKISGSAKATVTIDALSNIGGGGGSSGGSSGGNSGNNPPTQISIISIDSIADINVTNGTSLSNINLPVTAKVYMSDSSRPALQVTWDNGTPAYDGSKAGEYVFAGTLTLPSNVANPNSLKATVKVIVAQPQQTMSTILSVDPLADINVANGTTLSQLNLPVTAKVYMSDGSSTALQVLWDNGTPIYDGSKAGEYVFSGTLTLPTNVANPNNLKAIIKVIVAQPVVITIIAVDPIADINVANGTALSALNLPRTAKVSLSDGSTPSLQVAWDNGTPAYDGTKAGEYIFSGTLTLPANVTNPNNCNATVKVIVVQAIPVPVTVTGVDPIADITVEQGTQLTSISIPGDVQITLSNNTKINVPVHWDHGTPPYDADTVGNYVFSGILEVSSGVTNPNNLKAAVKVIVIPPKPYTLKEIVPIADKTVPKGTPLYNLLPHMVQAVLDNGKTELIKILWDNGTPAYNENILGEYVFSGIPELPSNIINPNNLKASVKVTVIEPEPTKTEVVIVHKLNDISVPNSTLIENLNLPQHVDILLNNNTDTSVPVVWDNGTPIYDGSKAGEYVFSGTLTLPQNIANPNNLKATIKVIVAQPVVITITAVDPIADINVANGTALSALNLPSTSKVSLSDGSTPVLQVSWDNGTPAYDGSKAGEYIFLGTLTLPANITNPGNLKATVKVIVAQPETTKLTVEGIQGFNDLTVPVGTTFPNLNLPKSVNIHLSDNSFISVPVSWDNGIPAYDSRRVGEYNFSGTLLLPASVTNPKNIKASIKVIMIAAPGIPSNLKATSGDRKITLTWDAVSGATGYKVILTTTPEAGGGTEYTATTNTYTIYDLAKVQTYYFKVKSTNKVAESGFSNTISAITNIDVEGNVYDGDLMIVNNESPDISISQPSGEFPAVLQKSFSASKNFKSGAYKIDITVPMPEVAKEQKFSPQISLKKIAPAELKIGDKRVFNTLNISTNQFEPLTAELKYQGKYCEVWVDPKNTGLASSKATQLGKEFEDRIYSMVRENFYIESDVNGDGRVAILCFDIKDGFSGSGGYVAGYFSPRDLFPSTAVQYSNELEVFYIDTYPTMGLDKTTPDVDAAYSTLAHEFQHMVNFNDYLADPNQAKPMDTWLNEAFSLAAEHHYNGVQQDRIDYYNSSYSIRDGHSLLNWNNNGDILSNYSLSYLFSQYLRVQTRDKLGSGKSIYKEIIQDSDYTYKAVEKAIQKYVDKDMGFGQFLTCFRTALAVKASTGLFGFGGEAVFNTIDTPVFTGTTINLKGGGSVLIQLKDSFTDPGEGKRGADIRYIGIYE
ncbi:MAG: Ig-like domain-containing protein [Clostridia bacterium]|nr:Ig-like domain-containing protein [Clostridia bacterium]